MSNPFSTTVFMPTRHHYNNPLASREGRVGRGRRIVVVLLLALGLALAAPSLASARDSAARKLGRGVSNIGLGVLAIPGQIVRTSQERGPFVGATWGFVKGVGFMAATEVIGVYELLTCPFEAPPKFKPILQPEFPWQYFTERAAPRRREPASRTTR